MLNIKQYNFEDFLDNNLYCDYDDRLFSFSSESQNDNNPFLNYDDSSFNYTIDKKNPSDFVDNQNGSISLFNMEGQFFEPHWQSNSLNLSLKRTNIIQSYNKTNIADEKINTQISQRIKASKLKIFNIKKVKKKCGRNYIHKNDKKHTKNKNDNIISKIKRALYNHFLIFINNKLKNSKNQKLNNLKLVKNGNSAIMYFKKEENLTLLKSTLKEILSNNISTKYRNKDSSHNKKTIKKIINQNDEEINNILNIKFEELLEIYNLKNENKLFKDFIKIDVDIKKFKEKGEEDCYIEEYENISKNLKETINSIHPRRKRKK